MFTIDLSKGLRSHLNNMKKQLDCISKEASELIEILEPKSK